MGHWGFGLGGFALAAIPVIHWILLKRMFAVSGRFTALVNRVRYGPAEDDGGLSESELIEALRHATVEAMGAEALDAADAAEAVPPPVVARRPRTVAEHLTFLAAVLVGGLASAWLSGTLHVGYELRTQLGERLLSGSALPFVLLAGGMLVGFGTRMAAGCTSGHGLCGVSRLQKGSILATAAFFGAGIATSFLLGAVL